MSEQKTTAASPRAGTRTAQLPQPDEVTERERDDAMASYLMMFASWAVGLPLPLLNLIASAIYYAVNRKTSKFVAFHALQSFITQVPVSVLNAGVVGWGIALLVTGGGAGLWPFVGYTIFTAAANIIYIVFSIVALIHAHKGRLYYMPVFGRLAFSRHYGRRETEREQAAWVNRPPEGL